MRACDYRCAAVCAERDCLHICRRSDLVKRQKRGGHGLEQHERRLFFIAAFHHVRTPPDVELRDTVRQRCDLTALVRHRDRVPLIRNKAYPLAQQRGLAKAGRREQQHGLRRAIPDPRDDLRREAGKLPRNAQIERGQSAHADDLSVFLRHCAAHAQPMSAPKGYKPVFQAFRIAVHRIACRAAEGFAQLLCCDRPEVERLLALCGFGCRRLSGAQAQLLHFPLPVQRG